MTKSPSLGQFQPLAVYAFKRWLVNISTGNHWILLLLLNDEKGTVGTSCSLSKMFGLVQFVRTQMSWHFAYGISWKSVIVNLYWFKWNQNSKCETVQINIISPKLLWYEKRLFGITPTNYVSHPLRSDYKSLQIAEALKHLGCFVCNGYLPNPEQTEWTDSFTCRNKSMSWFSGFKVPLNPVTVVKRNCKKHINEKWDLSFIDCSTNRAHFQLCVCVGFMHDHVCADVCGCGDQSSVLGVVLQGLSTLFFKQNISLGTWGSLMTDKSPELHCFWLPGSGITILVFSHGHWEGSWCSQTCIASSRVTVSNSLGLHI